MKTLFACLLALCLAAPACAAEEEDEELFIDNAIVIVLDEDMDNKELEKSVKAILQRLKSGDVLGSAAKGVKIYAMSDIDLGEFYSRKEYPALDKYRDDLSKLNSRLYAIIATDAFAAQGINAPEVKEWRRQCLEAQKRYAKAKLPPPAQRRLCAPQQRGRILFRAPPFPQRGRTSARVADAGNPPQVCGYHSGTGFRHRLKWSNSPALRGYLYIKSATAKMPWRDGDLCNQ